MSIDGVNSNNIEHVQELEQQAPAPVQNDEAVESPAQSGTDEYVEAGPDLKAVVKPLEEAKSNDDADFEEVATVHVGDKAATKRKNSSATVEAKDQAAPTQTAQIQIDLVARSGLIEEAASGSIDVKPTPQIVSREAKTAKPRTMSELSNNWFSQSGFGSAGKRFGSFAEATSSSRTSFVDTLDSEDYTSVQIVRETRSLPRAARNVSSRPYQRLRFKVYDVNRSLPEFPSYILVKGPNGFEKKIILTPGNHQIDLKLPNGQYDVEVVAGTVNKDPKAKDKYDNVRVKVLKEKTPEVKESATKAEEPQLSA